MSSRQDTEIQNGQMKNFSAANTSRIIPYNPLYRQTGKTVTGAILFQQLEYWFAKMGKPFYKFTEPSEKNSYYKEGQSWTEELGFSSDEFRTAFDNIGIRYSSKAEYETAVIMNRETGGRLDVFAGKFYCSYHDKIKGITVYYRNHSKTDEWLYLFTETNNAELRNSETPSYAEQPPQATEQGKPKSEYKQENTSENTQKNKTVEKKRESAPSDKILGHGEKSPAPSLPEKPSIPSQSGYDAFKAEYESLYLESQNLKLSSRYILQIEEIANMLDNDTDKLRILLSNFPRSWWGVKGMRPTPDNVFKFLDKNADAQTVNYKGEVKTDRYKDENGKYTNQDGASDSYKIQWKKMAEESARKQAEAIAKSNIDPEEF
jgi:hypothetical protein